MPDAYIPMRGPHPGEQWAPSNGTDGYSFIEQWCGNCARDKAAREGAPIDECDDNEVCQILGASFRGEAVEWRELEDGRCICVAHVPATVDTARPYLSAACCGVQPVRCTWATASVASRLVRPLIPASSSRRRRPSAGHRRSP